MLATTSLRVGGVVEGRRAAALVGWPRRGTPSSRARENGPTRSRSSMQLLQRRALRTDVAAARHVHDAADPRHLLGAVLRLPQGDLEARGQPRRARPVHGTLCESEGRNRRGRRRARRCRRCRAPGHPAMLPRCAGCCPILRRASIPSTPTYWPIVTTARSPVGARQHGGELPTAPTAIWRASR